MRTMLVGSGYGRTVGLRGPGESLAAAEAALPFWWTASDDEPDKVFDVPAPDAVPFIVGALEQWVAEHAVGLIFVHAAVVALDGRALVMPGRSRAGKSTMCAELLRHGASYLSDEYAVLDADGRLHPYPRPLQLRNGSDVQVPTSASSLGARVESSPVEIGAVAVVDYVADTQWSATLVDRGQATLLMLDNTLCAQSRTEEALDTILAALASSEAVKARRGPAADAAGPLLSLIRERRR